MVVFVTQSDEDSAAKADRAKFGVIYSKKKLLFFFFLIHKAILFIIQPLLPNRIISFSDRFLNIYGP